jgi:hypothetical protein
MPKQAWNQSDIDIVRETIFDEALTILLKAIAKLPLCHSRESGIQVMSRILDPRFLGGDSSY